MKVAKEHPDLSSKPLQNYVSFKLLEVEGEPGKMWVDKEKP